MNLYEHPRLYRLLDALVSLGYNSKARRRFEAYLLSEMPRGSSVLELGSGNGSFSKDFYSSYRVLGVDLSCRGPGRLRADAHLLPLRSKGFDYSVFPFSLSTIGLGALKEARRVSRRAIYVLDFVASKVKKLGPLGELGGVIFGSKPLSSELDEYKVVEFSIYGIYKIRLDPP